MSNPTVSSPYTRAVVTSMRKLYPESLADKSFDNTGLLLESPYDPARRQRNSVLLTIDLTKAVADEAIRRKDSIVVSYHPIIFRGLKSLTLANTQQQSLLRLASQGISVYSPHTAVDSQVGGLGDWLADIVTGTPTASSSQTTTKAPSSTLDDPFTNRKRPTYQLQHHPSQLSLHTNTLTLGHSPHKRTPITPSTNPAHPSGAGMGRIIHLDTPLPLTSIIDRIGLGLGNPKAFPIAIPQGKSASEMQISSIAICAGSGGGLFSEIDKRGESVDLLFTGELSHHEALAAIEKGRCVIALFHSNTERGFLHGVLKGQLEEAVGVEWERLRREEGVDGEDHVEVAVSEVDRDPYGMMIFEQDE